MIYGGEQNDEQDENAQENNQEGEEGGTVPSNELCLLEPDHKLWVPMPITGAANHYFHIMNFFVRASCPALQNYPCEHVGFITLCLRCQSMSQRLHACLFQAQRESGQRAEFLCLTCPHCIPVAAVSSTETDVDALNLAGYTTSLLSRSHCGCGQQGCICGVPAEIDVAQSDPMSVRSASLPAKLQYHTSPTHSLWLQLAMLLREVSLPAVRAGGTHAAWITCDMLRTPSAAGSGNKGLPRRSGHSCTVLADGRLLVFGGIDDQERHKNDMFIMDAKRMTWYSLAGTAKGAPPKPRAYHSYAQLAFPAHLMQSCNAQGFRSDPLLSNVPATISQPAP